MNLKKYCVIFVLVGTVITMMGVPARTLSISQSPFKNDSTDIGKENPESVVDEVLWVVGDEPNLQNPPLSEQLRKHRGCANIRQKAVVLK